MARNLRERIQAKGPKKILACDGGGILGLMSVEILAKLESELRAKSGRVDLVLADFFDFACGTSTGAIIAACVACGMPVDQIREFYCKSGPLMFEKASLVKRLSYSYNDEPLAKMLRHELNRALGEPEDGSPVLLGDPRLRTLLMMVMRNHTTDSPWPVSNNPDAKYNSYSRNDCNLNLPLWQLVRASTAAPTYFPPEVVVFAEGTPNEYSFVFVDGGVTSYNNPAFLAFLMATAAPYKVDWPTGADNLLVVSVGTGSAAKSRPDLKPSDLWLLDNAKNIPAALMNGASAGWDMTCRVLGECRHGEPIDREFGHGIGSRNWTGEKLFTYLRYDPDVTADGLKALGLSNIKPETVQMMDSVKYVNEIQEVGRKYAEQVSIQHFENFVL